MDFNFNKFSKFKTLFVNTYFFFMSFFLIAAFVYFRFFVKRSEYSLELLKTVVGFKYFCLCFGMLSLHLVLLCYILYIIFNKKNEGQNIFFKSLENLYSFLIKKPLYFLLDKTALHIPYSGTLIIHYCYFFRKNDFRLFLMYLLNFIFYFAPKILMSTLFFIEIVFYHQLKIFIQLFWILLLPIIYIVFLNLSEKFYDNNINAVESEIYVKPTGTKNKHGCYTRFLFAFKEKDVYSEEDFEQFVENWYLLFHLLNLNAMIRRFMNKWSPYITSYTSSLYLIAFSYKIYYLFIL